MIEFISRLPQGYQEVEYIESSGTQYIDTGYKPTSDNLRIACEFEYTADHSNSSVFGSESSGHYSIVPWEAPKFYVGSSVRLLAQTTALNTKYALDAHANAGTFTVSLNGTTNSASYSGSILTTVNIGIFCEIVAGVANYFCSMKLYDMYIYDNGNLVRDFVPCYRKADNVAGLYDLVNNVFYTNAGSGVFAVGNKRGEWVITAGGMIPMQYALRRRMMQSNEKTWTVTIQNHAEGDASPYYPKINGIASGPGIYKVRDGDVITLYGHVGQYELYYVEVIYIDDKVWHANYPQTISQQHIVQTNCNIVISSSFSRGYTYKTRLTTT